MRKIYVGNIPFNATEQDIKDLFSGYGKPFMGKTLTVSEARPQQPRHGFQERRGGFGGGMERRGWR
ncbi:MAG: RNA-binding protein [Thermodesulfovibrionales bacterium]|nr:RNA-binding protein [Thermodesulfovibrionales bacterium]